MLSNSQMVALIAKSGMKIEETAGHIHSEVDVTIVHACTNSL